MLEVIIVGAGPSGLATAVCLKQGCVDFVILEREHQVGSRWRNHYERLHLHTFRNLSTLPGMAWPKGTPKYPTRQQVVDYLQAYANKFDIQPEFGQDVQSIERVNENGTWTVRTQDKTWRARTLVVAAGYNRTPHAPTWPGQDTFTGDLLQSIDYRSARTWAGKRALVVGSGNTGAEIAVDFVEHDADVSICIRGPIHLIPRDIGPLPAQYTGIALSQLPRPLADKLGVLTSKLYFGDLSKYGIVRPKKGPISMIASNALQQRVAILSTERARSLTWSSWRLGTAARSMSFSRERHRICRNTATRERTQRTNRTRASSLSATATRLPDCCATSTTKPRLRVS
jgi:cation diffusion facilitator CzcD-associated flavoprotein CzcO